MAGVPAVGLLCLSHVYAEVLVFARPVPTCFRCRYTPRGGRRNVKIISTSLCVSAMV